MTAPGHQPPPKSADEDVDSSQQTEGQEPQDISEQDVQQGKLVAQLAGAFGLLNLKGFHTANDAFKVLSDPKLAENLLDLEHPEKYADAVSAGRIAKEELGRKANAKRGFAQKRFLFWKGKKFTSDDLDRVGQATKAAGKVRGVVKATEDNIRFRNALSIYGITDEQKLRTTVAEWMKNNPGRSLDEALAVMGTQLSGLDKPERGKEKEEKRKGLQKQNEKAGKQAIEESKLSIGRGKEVIEGYLDRSKTKPTGTQEEINLNYIETGTHLTNEEKNLLKQTGAGVEESLKTIPTVSTPPQPKYDLGQLAGGFAEGAHFEEIMGRPPSVTPLTSQPAPIAAKTSLPGTSGIKNSIINFLKNSAALQAVRLAMRNALAYSLKALRGVGLRSTAKVALSLTRSAFPFLFKTVSRLAITAGGAAASLGTTLLAQAGLELLKKVPGLGKIAQALDDAIMGLVKGAAYFAVGAVVVIFLLVIIETQSLFSHNTINNPVVLEAQKQNINYSWNEFEKRFLVKELDNKAGWLKFEKENFVPTKEFLSLNPDGHN